MSDTSTSNVPDLADYEERIAIVSDLAVAAGKRITKIRPERYYHRQDYLSLVIRGEALHPDGSTEQYMSDTIFVSGWKLLTRPYFLTEPGQDLPSAVFRPEPGYLAQQLVPNFLEEREQGLVLFPSLADLRDLQHELTAILV